MNARGLKLNRLKLNCVWLTLPSWGSMHVRKRRNSTFTRRIFFLVTVGRRLSEMSVPFTLAVSSIKMSRMFCPKLDPVYTIAKLGARV